MTDFWEVVWTPSFLPRILHVFFASWTAGAALMMSVSAWYLLKKRHLELAQANMKVGLSGFILFSCFTFFAAGPQQALEVTAYQPLKLASMEGLWQSTSCAPLYLVGWVDEEAQTTTGISIPCLLSVLAYLNPSATVQGIDSFAPDPTPPINLLFQVYHWMFGLGSLFVPIGLLAGLLYLRKHRLFTTPWMLRILVVTVFFVESAIIAGWWTAEIGRQPWVVYNVLKTADGVSPLLSAEEVVFSLGTFIALYAILLALFLYLLNGKIQQGPEPLEEVETVHVSTLPDTFRDVFKRRDRADKSGEE